MYFDAAIEAAIQNAASILGYPLSAFQQKTSITSIMKGRDVFVCLPTCSGRHCPLTVVVGIHCMIGLSGSQKKVDICG